MGPPLSAALPWARPTIAFAAAILVVPHIPGAHAQQGTERQMTLDSRETIAALQQDDHVQAWQRYGLMGIPLVKEVPVIDGAVGVREWAGAAVIGHVVHMASGLMVPDMARWYLCYTHEHLCLAFQFERPDAARAPSARDFCEILLDATHEHKRYYNVAGNLQEILWDGIGPNVDRKA